MCIYLHDHSDSALVTFTWCCLMGADHRRISWERVFCRWKKCTKN